MFSNLPVANSNDVFVYLPTGIDSVDIKSAICGCINCIPLQRKAVWRGTRPFRLRAGDVIHPVLWLVKGRAIARLVGPWLILINERLSMHAVLLLDIMTLHTRIATNYSITHIHVTLFLPDIFYTLLDPWRVCGYTRKCDRSPS